MILYIALGGGVGALARFAISGWVTTWAAVGFPWGTFAVNVLGSTVLGYVLGSGSTARRPHVHALLTTGFCGGFTTFSTVEYETLVLFQRGDHVLAVLYSLSSVATCMAGVVSGLLLATTRRSPAR